jgi:hypothetical protein
VAGVCRLADDALAPAPLSTLSHGASILKHAHCETWFLFCRIESGGCQDGVPLSASSLSSDLRSMCKAISRDARGLRAMRAGVVTRPLTRALIASGGRCIADAEIAAIARLGGRRPI